MVCQLCQPPVLAMSISAITGPLVPSSRNWTAPLTPAAAPEATDAPAWSAEDRTDPDSEVAPAEATDGAAPAAWADPGQAEAVAEAL